MSGKDLILVTGAAGFIGSNFVRQTITGGRAGVVSLDKLTYAGHRESLAAVMAHPRHVFVEGDIADRDLLASLFAEHRPAAVVHFAAESHVDRSIDGPAPFVLTNVVGTFELLDVAREYWSRLARDDRGRFRLLHVSTDEVYGSLGTTGRFTENTPYAPNSPYAASKAAADHFVRAYHRTYGLPTLITNCSNNYGPYQFPEKLIPQMIQRSLAGQPLPVYGDGRQVRDWLHVDDHCRGLTHVLEAGRPGETYNIGGGNERTNLEIVQAICRHVDRICPHLSHRPCERLITFVEDRPGHDRRYALDATKLMHALEWAPRIQLDDGLEQTVRWYIENHTWVQRVTRNVDAKRRVGVGHSEHGPPLTFAAASSPEHTRIEPIDGRRPCLPGSRLP